MVEVFDGVVFDDEAEGVDWLIIEGVVESVDIMMS
jgi:hypothetical protein